MPPAARWHERGFQGSYFDDFRSKMGSRPPEPTADTDHALDSPA